MGYALEPFKMFIMGILRQIGEWMEGINERRLTLTAEKAWEQTRYAGQSIDNLVKYTIRDINDFINYKSKIKGQSKVIYLFEFGYDEVCEKVGDHYKECGYLVKTKPIDPDEGRGIELSVSWYKKGDDNGKD